MPTFITINVPQLLSAYLKIFESLHNSYFTKCEFNIFGVIENASKTETGAVADQTLYWVVTKVCYFIPHILW